MLTNPLEGIAAALGGERVADDHRPDGLAPGLDQAFDSGVLAIRHGAGAGRLRIWKLARALRCQVDDGDPSASGRLVSEASGTDAPVQAPEKPWPSLPGHGLWVVRQVADQMRIVTGPRGTRATIVFDLP